MLPLLQKLSLLYFSLKKKKELVIIKNFRFLNQNIEVFFIYLFGLKEDTTRNKFHSCHDQQGFTLYMGKMVVQKAVDKMILSDPGLQSLLGRCFILALSICSELVSVTCRFMMKHKKHVLNLSYRYHLNHDRNILSSMRHRELKSEKHCNSIF